MYKRYKNYIITNSDLSDNCDNNSETVVTINKDKEEEETDFPINMNRNKNKEKNEDIILKDSAIRRILSLNQKGIF